jgi:hypothetical protein
MREQFPNADIPIVWMFPVIVSVLVIFEQFSNALSPMVPTFVGMFKVLNDILFWNALIPIDCKLPPSATASIREQFPNALFPIVWMFPVIVSVLVIFLQSRNALSPMLVTLIGILIVPIDVQFLNAPVRIVRKLPPNATPGMREQLKNAPEPIDVMLPAIVILLVILLHSVNTPVEIVLTLSGIFMVPKEVQSVNALEPMDDNLPPRNADVSFEQFKKARDEILRILPTIVKALDRLTQFSKALTAILPIFVVILMVPNEVQFWNE